MPIQLTIPVSLVALLPSVLDLLERVLDSRGLLGGKFIRARLREDDRAFIRDNFVAPPPQNEAKLRAIETYFDFEATASDILKRHFAFILSLYFASVESHHDLLKIEGWPVIGLAIVGVSMFIFILLLFVRNRWSGAAEKPLWYWSVWTWMIFLVIVSIEAWEHLAP